jgi:putative sigma-54 modulation protein
MKINIQPKDFNATPGLLDFVIEKTRKIFTFYEQAISCDVVLKIDKSDTDTNKTCTMQLVIPGNDLHARAQCSTFEEAVMQCIEIVKRKVIKKKSKQNNKVIVQAGLSDIVETN